MERPEFDRLLTAALPGIERMAQFYAARYNLRHEWQDIAQTALLKLLRFADYYDPGKGEFMPWACVVIINTIKIRIIQAYATPLMKELDACAAASSAIPDPESELQAAMIMDKLNEETRLYVEGYNYPEIAARCGFRSRVTAMTRIDKCADRLRLVLEVNPERCRRERYVCKMPV